MVVLREGAACKWLDVAKDGTMFDNWVPTLAMDDVSIADNTWSQEIADFNLMMNLKKLANIRFGHGSAINGLSRNASDSQAMEQEYNCVLRALLQFFRKADAEVKDDGRSNSAGAVRRTADGDDAAGVFGRSERESASPTKDFSAARGGSREALHEGAVVVLFLADGSRRSLPARPNWAGIPKTLAVRSAAPLFE
jgi:hypothetical protein